MPDKAPDRPIYAEMQAALQERYKHGTYSSIAADCGLSNIHVRSLILGEASPKKLSLDSFFRLFPHAEITLNEQPPSTPVRPHVHLITPPSPSEAVAAYRGRLALALAGLEIPTDALAAVMRTLASTQ